MSDAQNSLRKQCGQVTRVTNSSLIIITYKTFALSDAEIHDYDWDFVRRRTIVTLREPIYKKDEFVLLIKTINTRTNRSDYAITKLDGSPLLGFLGDVEILQRRVYVDKKWMN